MQANASSGGSNDLEVNDLGPLAWVLDELRKSLDGATKAIRRFVRDAELARGSDLESLDASQLRIARQQLHQAVGALEMVGLRAPAKVLRAMEALAQKFVQRPELCSDEVAVKVERASVALTEYLQAVLRGKSISSVALFPQYRAVQELVGEERIHPADLWAQEWRWVDVALSAPSDALAYDPAVRAKMDQAVLSMVKSGSTSSAGVLRDISLGLAAGQQALEPRVYWKISAAFFEALALDLCPVDGYVKRAASRVLQQYATLARGEPGVSDRLALDLLFFCSQALPVETSAAPVLHAVRQAYGLTQARPVDYETVQLGRFDPVVLVQARKRIATATETWSALSGGDTNRLKFVTEQFNAVVESVLKLHPESGELARALMKAIESTVRSGEPPSTPLSMEVATTILYLDATYEDMDLADARLTERSVRLAQRLAHVGSGGQPEALEGWMEELYRRVSDRQTMGSVVDELRTTLAEVEKSLDQFFRTPKDKLPLHEVPSRLAQMRGVLSVLGLDQASLAMLRIRDCVEKFLVEDIGEGAAHSGLFEKLGNSLGALGFMIDMLSYQRALAKKLFVYDEALGEFRSVMGREKMAVPTPAVASVAIGGQSSPVVESTEPSLPPIADSPEPVPVPAAAVQTVAVDDVGDDDAELLDIFLEEAREVVGNGLGAINALKDEPADLGSQTTLRRVFHTLKGSSRMVGLNEFGEAAWSMEQLLNDWLAEQKPVSDELVHLSDTAMQGFGRWVEDIAGSNAADWSAAPFRVAADALRMENRVLALDIPGATPAFELELPEIEPPAEPEFPDSTMGDVSFELELEDEPDFEPTRSFDLDFDVEHQGAGAASQPVGGVAEPALMEFEGIDFGSLAGVPDAPHAAPVLSDEDAVELPELPAMSEEESAPIALPEVQGEPVPQEAGPVVMPPVSETEDEQVKIVGALRIGIPLYNVYLNEADEWSRRLQMELSEWALELHRPIPDSVVTLAHSLAGSSSTVGFQALSGIARELESALQHVQLHARGSAEHARVFVLAAEDIRRLLHQFAAGFLKEPDPQLMEELRDIQATEFAPTGSGDAQQPVVAALELTADAEDIDLDFVPLVMPQPAAPPLSGGAAQIVVREHEEEIDAADAIDPDLFPIFEEEAMELLPHLGGALRQWAIRPDNASARAEVLRVLHTLKGSARLAGAMRLGERAHRLESVIEPMDPELVQASQIEPLLTRFDALQADFDDLCAGTVEAEEAAAALPVAQEHGGALAAVQGLESPQAVRISLAVSTANTLAPARLVSNQSVRVRSQLLDRLVNQAGEVMITRSRLDARLGQLRGSLDDLTGNLDRLRHQLRDIEVQAESQMQSRMAQAKDTAQGFDPLEFDRFTRVQELTRMMAESVNDVATVQRNLQRTIEGTEDDLVAQARQARELQRDLLRTRMVEFESISERLYGVVRQAAKDAGKQVKLDIQGGSLEMDRGVLDRMAPAFEHMLRNSVAHGVEAPGVREAAGKSAAGTITIGLQQEGNDVSVVFNDDGAGLNLPRIREKAMSTGLVSVDQPLSDAEAANLIFMPGFSTAAQVTELAGRGIGMDVVRAEINALGGRIETSTEAGQGTRFRLVLPLTTAVTQVVMMRLGNLSIGVPANLVEIVRRATAEQLEQAYQSQVFEYNGEALPFFWAGALLQASSRSHDTHGKTHPVAIFRSAGQRLAVHIDEVLGNQEVVVKNLGPQLSRLPGLAGMSVLASGAVVLIYNPVALVSVYGDKARELQTAGHADAAGASAISDASGGSAALLAADSEVPLVLVVDDSITVRRVTQRLLKREGYRVALAIDGLQALERLQEEKPAVVLSDIEMPRMDGFDLVRNIRMDDKLRDLPIIMITSRIAEKHREHARELGVDHYLGKPYSEDELLNLVRRYCTQAVEA